MKKALGLFCLSILFACTKKDLIETQKPAAVTYQIRVAAVEDNGTKSYTPISRVKSGKVAVEFETAEASEIREYNVEVSVDGSNFKSVKTIKANLQTPNGLYHDTVVLD